MRRILLLIILVLPYFLKGQSYTYQCSSGLSLAGTDSSKMTCFVDIHNNTGALSNIMCRISSSNMTAGHLKYFCFGLCYDPTVTEAPAPFAVNPGKNQQLEAYAVSNNLPGTDDVTYQFYDVSGNSDTLTFTIHYDFLFTGIADVKKPVYSLSIASPNPANNLTSISYDFSAAKDARIVVYNLLGSPVKEMKLQNSRGLAFIETASLNAGIYLYTLFVDGVAVTSKKLVVAH